MKKTEQKKFNCDDIEKRVQAYLDDQLSQEEFVLFEDHLSYCLPCDKKIEFEQKLKVFIKLKAAEKECPKSLEQELKKIVRSSNSQRKT